MRYNNVVSGIFLERPNRFIAHVEIQGEKQVVHVKNTGRCRELLLPGTRVWLEISDNPARKTKYDLVTVEKRRENRAPLLVNMDSQMPNHLVREWLPNSGLFSPQAMIRPEVTFGASRFDFYIDDGQTKTFLEVKGVTLEREGVAMFPDAPTERGVKHLQELIKCIEQGYRAVAVFVIKMKEIHIFRPNTETHPAFAQALKEAKAAGVEVLAVDCRVREDSIFIDKSVPVEL